jgi:Glycosyl transferases group 1
MISLAATVPVGQYGGRPASAHVRVLRRLEHPIVRRAIVANVVETGRLLFEVDADLVLVQRTAVDPDLAEPLVEHLRSRRIPLVVELDDNLFLKDPDDLEYGGHLDSLARLVEAASLVTVSTEPLREALSDRAKDVAVVPNALDERLWGPPPHRESSLGTRLLFFGTRTHADDLALLRPVVERLRHEVGHGVQLFVIGGEHKGEARDWYSRVTLPPRRNDYPAFARWIRKRAGQFDIGVAPLVDNEFNRSKSDLKFLDYSALGLPGVYSDVPAFASCVDGVTGLKTPNTDEGWCEALVRLCTDAQLRAALGRAAQGYVFRERCLAHSAAAYVELLTRVARARGLARHTWHKLRRRAT